MQTITAAATRVTTRDRGLADRHRQRRHTWQSDAWRYYDEIGAIGYAGRYIGNSLSRVRLFPAVQPDPEQPPDPAEGPAGARATVELARLASGTAGQLGHSKLLYDLGVNLFIAGECWLVGLADGQGSPGGEQWGIHSVDEVIVDTDGKWRLREAPDDKGRVLNIADDQMDGTDVLVRLHREHPRWGALADSAMRNVLEDCEELQILSRSIRAVGRSRMNAGVFLVPNEVTFPRRNPEDLEEDPFVEDLLVGMTTPIEDEGSAAAVVPLVFRVPSESIEHFRHISFAREFDDVAAKTRPELLERIATGIDLPNEVLLGKADLNHWSAWSVDEETFKAHLEPYVQLACGLLTDGFLRPALGTDPAAASTFVWYDAGALVSHPDRSADAKDLHAAIVISDAALRQATAFTDEDAPDDAEIARRIEQARAMRGTAAGPDMPADAATVTAGPPPSPVTSSAMFRQRRDAGRVGYDLAAIDRTVMTRLQSVCDAAVRRALEREGAKLRRRASKDGRLAAVLRDVPNHRAVATAGPDLVRQHFADPNLLEDDDIVAPVADAWTPTVASAWTLVDRITGRYGATVDDDQRKDHAAAGWLLLSAAVLAAVRERRFSPDPTVGEGEWDGTATIQAGQVRAAMARAGGATGPVTRGGAIVHAATGMVEGLLATGPDVIDLLTGNGLQLDEMEWSYGAALRLRPFEPHIQLDGLRFASWDDDQRVAAGDAGWLGVPFMFPGDHPGCLCDWIPLFTEP